MEVVTRAIAMAFLAGAWSPEAMTSRAAEALGRRHRFLLPLARRVCAQVEANVGVDDLARAIRRDEQFRRAYLRADPKPRALRWLQAEPVFGPLPDWLDGLDLPRWTTVDEVAAAVHASVDELAWLAQRERGRAFDPRRAHYRHRWIPKRGGAWRLLEAPKERLKRVQGAILRALVERVPPHEAAHGFRSGRSVVSHASHHCGKRVVIRLDLESFFSSIGEARVCAIFGALGHPRPVARLLAALCCTATPEPILALRRPTEASQIAERWTHARLLAAPHLPQGAPTSPALSNLAAHRLDRRLSALARAFDASYTRYADDLVFSGDRRLDGAVDDFVPLAAAAALDEGYGVQWRKTRVMRSGGRQEVAGVVVNRHPNVRRADLDRLEAIIANCLRHGPETQNRGGLPDFRAHLEGRVGWVSMVNPARAAKLRDLLARVRWA